MQNGRPTFDYTITRDAEGWRWSTLDGGGAVQHHGRATGRAEAAAHVIRALLHRQPAAPLRS